MLNSCYFSCSYTSKLRQLVNNLSYLCFACSITVGKFVKSSFERHQICLIRTSKFYPKSYGHRKFSPRIGFFLNLCNLSTFDPLVCGISNLLWSSEMLEKFLHQLFNHTKFEASNFLFEKLGTQIDISKCITTHTH